MKTATTVTKLEYVAVYGRASMGDYYGCAFHVWAVFHQLSTHGQKFDPNTHMSLFNLKLCTHIWSTNINFRPSPLTLDFLV